ncbi:MAG: DUF4837 family protein [Candidatus Fermentibacteraceae bacterium]|nr:DUF4837 family protein [Candidatus Fermentibacteraceae bacterium]MBN2608713.1 DUF4837 family protein [Candidatus Fermentibacteraceae bacterium]
MKYFLLMTVPVLLSGCAGPASGPLKGVLVVYPDEMEMDRMESFLNDIQIQVTTVEPEDVFDFSVCSSQQFQGDLKTRRTILFLVDDPSALPDDLEPIDGIYQGDDLWATGQTVMGVVLPEFDDPDLLSSRLESAYERHLSDYIYGSFVSTQMSSPARIDSLLALGFSMDIPKSYSLAEWDPDGGFLQYQRRVSDECLLLLSVRWIEDDALLSPEDAVIWREAVARHHFHDSAADSVDRSMVQVETLDLRGLGGWRLLGMWRNPEHLNAGAFTSYVLRDGGRRFLLDMEIFHEHREKEPYIREGWIIMNTFIPGEQNGQ